MVRTLRKKKRKTPINKLTLRVLSYKNKKHLYKLGDPHKERIKSIDEGIKKESRKSKKSIRKAAVSKKARLNILRIYRKTNKPKECKRITQDMKYIDKKYGLGKTINICKKTHKGGRRKKKQ